MPTDTHRYIDQNTIGLDAAMEEINNLLRITDLTLTQFKDCVICFLYGNGYTTGDCLLLANCTQVEEYYRTTISNTTYQIPFG